MISSHFNPFLMLIILTSLLFLSDCFEVVFSLTLFILLTSFFQSALSLLQYANTTVELEIYISRTLSLLLNFLIVKQKNMSVIEFEILQAVIIKIYTYVAIYLVERKPTFRRNNLISVSCWFFAWHIFLP